MSSLGFSWINSRFSSDVRFLSEQNPQGCFCSWTLLAHLLTPLGEQETGIFFITPYWGAQNTFIGTLGSLSYIIIEVTTQTTIFDLYSLLVLYLMLPFQNMATHPSALGLPNPNWDWRCTGNKPSKVSLFHLVFGPQTLFPEFAVNIHAFTVPWKSISFLRACEITKLIFRTLNWAVINSSLHTLPPPAHPTYVIDSVSGDYVATLYTQE